MVKSIDGGSSQLPNYNPNKQQLPGKKKDKNENELVQPTSSSLQDAFMEATLAVIAGGKGPGTVGAAGPTPTLASDHPKTGLLLGWVFMILEQSTQVTQNSMMVCIKQLQTNDQPQYALNHELESAPSLQFKLITTRMYTQVKVTTAGGTKWKREISQASQAKLSAANMAIQAKRDGVNSQLIASRNTGNMIMNTFGSINSTIQQMVSYASNLLQAIQQAVSSIFPS